jgi:hypothetical protein
MTSENPDFPGFTALIMITESRWPEIRPCDRSHKVKPATLPENSA